MKTQLFAALLLAISVLATPSGAQLPMRVEEQPDGSTCVFIDPDPEPVSCAPAGTGGVPDPTALLVPTVSVTAVDAVMNEAGDVTGVFRISAADGFPPESDVTVKYAFGGNATRGTDYAAPAAPDQVVVTSGSSKDITITGLRDSVLDRGEKVFLNITPDAAYAVDGGSAEIVLGDIAPQVVTITALDATMIEGAANNSTAQFRLTRSAPFVADLPVNVTTVAGTATTSDYSPTIPAQLVFPAGQSSITTTLLVFQDNEIEGLETVVVSVLPGKGYTLGAPSSAILNVVDDEVPVVDITANNPIANEAGATSGQVTVDRFIATTTPLQVTLAFAGSATNDTDYDRTDLGPAPFRLTIPANQRTATVTFTAVNDAVREGTEFINVTLVSSATNAYQTPLNTVAQVAVYDDEVPRITVTANKTSLTESDPAGKRKVQLTFERTGASTAALHTDKVLLVNVTLLSGPSAATLNTDFTLSNTTSNATSNGVTTFRIAFPANKVKHNVTLTLKDDSIPEGLESFIAVIKTAPGPNVIYGVGSPSRVDVSFDADNDVGTPVTGGGGVAADADGDTKPDTSDNCVNTANLDQKNTDGDALGDACDPDMDNDGLLNTEEGPAPKSDPLSPDTDGDGRGDRQEVKVDNTDPRDRFSPDYRATNIQVTSNGNGVQITWNAPAGSLASRYLVFRNSTATLIGTVQAAGKTAYSYNDTTYDGESHTYHVQAMLPSQSGTAYDAQTAGPASAAFQKPICEAYTKDSDKDGLCDQRETLDTRSDPLKADTDGDGFSDKAEVDAESDPSNADVTPKTVAGNEVALTREGPFWIGLILVVATLVALVAGIGMARRRSGEASNDPYQM